MLQAKPSLCLRFSVTLLLCIFQSSFSQTLDSQLQALLDFKNQLNDPQNYLISWNESDTPCNFFGISCDGNSSYVNGILLPNMSLTGNLSASISSLKGLSSLQLQSNSISGQIPQDLVNCTELQYINVSNNNFIGELPDFTALNKLQVLDVSTNKLSGNFPSWVGNLSSLLQLSLGENYFRQGKVPSSIGKLKKLTLLYLANCNLIGEIPPSIFDLQSLGVLDLSKNQLSGNFPLKISKLSKLWKVELYRNNFTGEIPPQLAKLKNLREFDISCNHMSGTVPVDIGNMNFTLFQLYQNNFSGKIPNEFANMQYLKHFSIYQNNFHGEFPSSFGLLSPLTSFDISENNFSGLFPKFLCKSNNLQYLLALNNNFSGEFPNSYSGCKSLLRLGISNNYFIGKFPSGLWGLPFAVIIDIANNSFVGEITADISISSSLTQLYVQNNRLSGKLPIEIGKLSQLRTFFAFNNLFSGQIISQVGDLMLLSSLHLEINNFTGMIPVEIFSCSSLVELNLAYNSLYGEISGNLSKLTSLNSLNLSHNLLAGSIPKVIIQLLKLSSLDVSNNKLSGKVPGELLMIAGEDSFLGNLHLCIDQQYQNQYGSNISICSSSTAQRDIFRRYKSFIITTLTVMLVILAVYSFVSYKRFKAKKLHKKVGIEDKFENFLRSKLHADDICKLKEENLIGIGGTGKVYRLDLNENRGTFAVKKIHGSKFRKVAMSEISILGTIRHRNILKFYAYLTRGECIYLVFEYMQNGSLYQVLNRELKSEKTELDWNRRYNIAVSAAKGIMYLHHDCSPSIIHRDIKSTNILLDEFYEAKIADFGIAKMVEDSSSCWVVGTHGYMAPELAYSPKVTEKTDVYSFGIVLLELLTGHIPTECQFREGNNMINWITSHIEAQNFKDIFDPRISISSMNDMIKVLKIATLCISQLPLLRPTMREVVNMLTDANPCLFNSRLKNYNITENEVTKMEAQEKRSSEIEIAIKELSLVKFEDQKEISTLTFLTISNLLVIVLDKVGPTMAVLRQDIQRNIENLEERYISNSSKYLSIKEILKQEAKEGTSKNTGSCSKAVVWLTRSLCFSLEVLQRLEKDPKMTLEQVVGEAYKNVLQPWHGWISTAAYKVAMKLIPEREIFISLLLGQDQDYDALRSDILKFVSLLQPFLDEISALLRELQLDKLKST